VTRIWSRSVTKRGTVGRTATPEMPARRRRDKQQLDLSVLCFSLILLGAFVDWLRLSI